MDQEALRLAAAPMDERLNQDVLRLICAPDTMQFVSMSQRIATGFVLRCTSRAFRDAVDYYNDPDHHYHPTRLYYRLSEVPHVHTYDIFCFLKKWHQVADVIVDLALLGQVDARVTWPVNKYRHPEHNCAYSFHTEGPGWLDRFFHGMWLKRRLEFKDVTTPLWALEGLLGGGHFGRITPALHAHFSKEQWKSIILPLAARYDCPTLYFARPQEVQWKHGRWVYDGSGLIQGGWIDDIRDPWIALYIFGSVRCFDALLDSFQNVHTEHGQLICIRSNLRRILRHISLSYRVLHERMQRLKAHLDARFARVDKQKRSLQAANKRKRADAEKGPKKAAKRPRRL